MTRFGVLALACTFAAAAPPLRAQQAPAGVRGEILAQFDEAAGKLVQLAEAIPQDKFTWRPGAGVRSVSEVFLHVAGSNHYMLTAVGVPAATQGENDLERSTTDKAQVIAQLKAANASVRAAIQAMRDADLDKATKLFGMDMTYRGVCLLLQSHVHEHLGQMIAYARTNGIVPPWSQSGQ
ncbi:MAG TPA: DinB family protein [Gemmatimonadales bacterium]|nr:DinB family protein [Gemmatimonadales bacterium]